MRSLRPQPRGALDKRAEDGHRLHPDDAAAEPRGVERVVPEVDADVEDEAAVGAALRRQPLPVQVVQRLDQPHPLHVLAAMSAFGSVNAITNGGCVRVPDRRAHRDAAIAQQRHRAADASASYSIVRCCGAAAGAADTLFSSTSPRTTRAAVDRRIGSSTSHSYHSANRATRLVGHGRLRARPLRAEHGPQQGGRVASRRGRCSRWRVEADVAWNSLWVASPTEEVPGGLVAGVVEHRVDRRAPSSISDQAGAPRTKS